MEVHAESQRLTLLRLRMGAAGVAVPARIWTAAWWSDPRGARGGVPPELAQSLGAAESVCAVTGRVVESDCHDTGRLRRVCLDAGLKTGHGGPLEVSAESVGLLRALAAAVGAAVAAGAPGALTCAAALRRLDPHGAVGTVTEAARAFREQTPGSAALAAPAPGSGRFCWAWEGSHHWQLRSAITPTSGPSSRPGQKV